ncbi:hypothetical protein [Novosphingobium sp. BW1]|uniref:hypothetical protein n=1 Tax=Novosphingobium sp. BW1 TaxID=2592621 RepID=UPI0011DEC1D8|nr:hypothetical protein [Novosphingobium sp. BW1]TYC85594.1 hypothetical protein FMM79_16165 [Novosphingobium sp. BW1]
MADKTARFARGACLRAPFVTPVTLGATLGAALALAPLSANAQRGELPAALRGLAQCRALAEDAARLACFDRESAALLAASDTGAVAIVDEDEARQVRRSLYGFAVPEIAIFSKTRSAKAETAEADSMEEARDGDEHTLVSTITQVEGLPRGYYRVTIAEANAVWETTTKRRSASAPKVGDSVEFEAAAFGTYWMRLNGHMGVKAHRVR